MSLVIDLLKCVYLLRCRIIFQFLILALQILQSVLLFGDMVSLDMSN